MKGTNCALLLGLGSIAAGIAVANTNGPDIADMHRVNKEWVNYVDDCGLVAAGKNPARAVAKFEDNWLLSRIKWDCDEHKED